MVYAMISLCIWLLFSLINKCALAHMEMSYPYPIRSQFDPKNDWSNIDYSNTSPLEGTGANYPCKNYHKDANLHVVATYNAGQTYNMNISGNTNHGGGSCQLSLSYDNGGTFVVIRSMIGGCPITTTYSFTIPSSAPSGRALFAWTWFNKIGNREMYMNCAVVDIVGTASSRLSGVQIFKANILTQGNCTTEEGNEPVFPKRGPDVIYGGPYAGRVPPDDPKLKTCSYAGEYSDMGLIGPAPTSSATAVSSSTIPSSTAAVSTSTSSPLGSGTAEFLPPPSSQPTMPPSYGPAPSYIPPPYQPAPSYGPAPSHGPGYGPEPSYGGHATTLVPTTSSTNIRTSSLSSTSASTSSSSRMVAKVPAKRPGRNSSRPATKILTLSTVTTSSSTTSDASQESPTDVTGPCSLGSIRCETNGESWSLCADNEFVFMGSVAPGTMCLSNKIVRRSDQGGACPESGQILCSGDGNLWSMCSGGVWVKMGSVAAGTKCTGGEIVAI